MKPQSLEARIAFLKEVQGLLEEERAAPLDADETDEAKVSQTLQDRAREIYREYALLLRGTREERYLDEFMIDFLPYKERVLEVLDKPIEDLKLSVRTYYCLHNYAGIKYVGQITEKTERDLLVTRNFGRRSLNEIKDVLNNLGLKLDMKIGYVPPEKRAQALETKLDMTLYDFANKHNLSIRAENCLLNGEIKYIGEIVVHSKKDLKERLKGFGKGCSDEVGKLLEREGLSYGMIDTYTPPEQRTKTP